MDTGDNTGSCNAPAAAKPAKTTFIRTYTGGVLYSPEDKYEKITFEDMQKRTLDRNVTDGWAAMMQHYFLAALIPERSEPSATTPRRSAIERYVIGLISPQRDVAAGDHTVFSTRLYVGPETAGPNEEGRHRVSS